MSARGTKRFDVLGLGCTAVDDLLYVPCFPAADEKVRVVGTVRRFGGLTGAALVAASRLGARCAYAGCLGTDELSGYVAGYLDQEGIDISHAPRVPQARVVHSIVVVGTDNGSRNVFFEGSGVIGAHDTEPGDEVLRACRVLFIDQWGMAGNLRAARVARLAGAAVVADFEDSGSPLFREVLDLVDHLVLGEKFAREISGQRDAAGAARALWRADRKAVIVTCGARGCWSVSAERGRAAVHHPALAVKATDTTGCGDVFHGAYAASLARGDALEARIRFAAAAAALKAKEAEIPRLAEVQKFLGVRPDSVGTRRAEKHRLTSERRPPDLAGRKRKPSTKL
jgi:sugar/nucleoside kinase (ribokinase family)